MKAGRNNRGISLQSVAESLSSTHYKQQKPNRNVTVKDNNPAERLRSGRHICDCQARVHRLIRNCMGCGRIVCEQEGSGPCFACGQLVCTREEREILNRKSKKSVELFNKLMGGQSNAKGSDSGALSLASLGNALTKAEEFRNKLLEADADTERRTRVHDLESDYYNMENNAYLTKKEREAIIARKEELKEMREKQKRALLVDFDLDKGTVTEVKEQHNDAMDPVILSILETSRQRHPEASSAATNNNSLFPSFVLKYDERYGRRSRNVMSEDEALACDDIICMPNEEMMYAEVERKGYAMPVQQPIASLLAVGIRRHVEWPEEVELRGPIFIAATSRPATQTEIDDEVKKCRDRAFNSVYGEDSYSSMSREYPLSYPSGAIVGRALLTNCLSLAEYVEQYPQGECADSRDGFVLVFSVFDPLLVPIPHLAPLQRDFYTVDKQLRIAIKHILDPYSFT
uniref:Activating signal cointegrator 1 n=1 Tax=Ascaris suum TaxID=6253 RepID=F1L3P8_ASCSU